MQAVIVPLHDGDAFRLTVSSAFGGFCPEKVLNPENS